MSIKNLRYFVRLDSRNKPVMGSLIARRSRPVSTGGRFLEIIPPNCCPADVVVATPTGTPSGTSEVTVVGSCGGTQLFSYTAVSASNAATVALLTTNFPAVATWAVVGTTITATGPVCDSFTFTVTYAEP